jgi:hypothetical protein
MTPTGRLSSFAEQQLANNDASRQCVCSMGKGTGRAEDWFATYLEKTHFGGGCWWIGRRRIWVAMAGQAGRMLGICCVRDL